MVSIHCDNRTDIPIEEIRKILVPVVVKNRFKLYEDIQYVHSNFQTVGILYADIVGYLMARVEVISSDSELFDSIPTELFGQNMKIQKLKTSLNLVKKIRSLSLYEVK